MVPLKVFDELVARDEAVPVCIRLLEDPLGRRLVPLQQRPNQLRELRMYMSVWVVRVHVHPCAGVCVQAYERACERASGRAGMRAHALV